MLIGVYNGFTQVDIVRKLDLGEIHSVNLLRLRTLLYICSCFWSDLLVDGTILLAPSMKPLRRMDRLAYLMGGRKAGDDQRRISYVGRAGLVGVVLFLLIVCVQAFNDQRVSSTRVLSEGNLEARGSSKFATTNAPKAYAADKGTLLGLSAEDSVKTVSSSSYKKLVDAAQTATRKRKMIDLTKDPQSNSMQVLLNTWSVGSFSPVHRHPDYSEAFVILSGTLAFFTFSDDGSKPTCHLLQAGEVGGEEKDKDKAIIVEKGQWHAMTAFPAAGHAVVFEISGHKYESGRQTKELAPFAPSVNDGLDGDAKYFEKNLLPLCK